MDRKITKKKGLKAKHIYISLLVVLVLGLSIKMIFGAESSTFRAEEDKLDIAEVSLGSFKDYISIVGMVEPKTTIYLDLEEGGKVIEKLIDEGETVKKGDVIVKLVNNDLKLQILNTESSLAYQSNELRNTLIGMEQQKINNLQQLLSIDTDIIKQKRRYEQNLMLFEKGFISKEDFLISKENYDFSRRDRDLRYQRMVQDSIFRANQKLQMNSSLKNMKQNLEMVRQRLENLNIKAPADGQLGSLEVEIGQSINRGQRIGQLHILNDFKIVADVDEHYIDRVRRGLSSTFTRNEKTYKQITKKVYPEVRDGRFKVDLIFDGESPENLRTGQTYHIKLELGQPIEAILLPRGGFFQSTGGQWVFVLDKSGTYATKRHIKIGRQNSQYFEVLEGLEAGEKVIRNNYDSFGDNDRIEFK
ncbi:efflux RND transporter periplasmic adaptor subunit [Ancylomarina euxinus]|uniref:Efflux RND transporter periplasmic adaptor subunit n=1 Tax=Ancylomarina euxinus TaxID=2283627 RepID=A0A425Y7R6_9BACT|nr:efflux RND transporter periplasmic adaptor subunit [Ancylomarina euxinus]MCZ4693644.1 efflux RND transporter periplasmic adaptor subunit [Ancylomarina euxinus]MUP13873.1 efflux RND transporter periplasmic adaptor subunit [Ancylomarina euxinus]RRG24498.1 efflux RND transporter periplasmic adaptor subunit [Ancylomarina euxinus]